jgi:hypothetical protein
MARKQFLFHATTPENAKKIRKEGLKRQNKPWVYLSERPTSWWQPGLVVLKVRITGLKHEMYHWPEIDEILVCGDINPERISQTDVKLPRRFLQNRSKMKGDNKDGTVDQ